MDVPATVFIMDNESWRPVSPPHLTKLKLCQFSEKASLEMRWGEPGDNLPTKLYVQPDKANREAAVKIMKWIADNDMDNPKELTLDALGLETFDECAYVYQTAHGLRLNLQLRGDNVRDEIDKYIHQAPLSLDEFVKIHELLWFDTGLTKAANNLVMYARVRGGKHVFPQMAEIEQYAKGKKIWWDMLKIEMDIVQKREEKKVQDEKAKEEWQKLRTPKPKKSGGGTFPPSKW